MFYLLSCVLLQITGSDSFKIVFHCVPTCTSFSLSSHLVTKGQKLFIWNIFKKQSHIYQLPESILLEMPLVFPIQLHIVNRQLNKEVTFYKPTNNVRVYLVTLILWGWGCKAGFSLSPCHRELFCAPHHCISTWDTGTHTTDPNPMSKASSQTLLFLINRPYSYNFP